MWTRFERLLRKIKAQLHRRQFQDELSEELELHNALKLQEYRESGLPTELAAAGTRRVMGNMTIAIEESRELRSFLGIEHFIQDIRFALRLLRRNPTFTIVSVLSLALGIGGNTAVFSIVNAMLIKPLPFAEPDRLVRITEFYPKALLEYFQQRSRTMEVASVSPGFEMNVTGYGPAFRITAGGVSANLFSLLGVAPQSGRIFEPGENQPGRADIAILSHQLWRSHFGADPGVIGRVVTVNGRDRRIVGVMPPGFAFPTTRVELWFPAVIDSSVMEDYWGGEFVPLIGRLRKGATLDQARGEVASLSAPVWSMFPFPMPHHWNANSTVIPLQTDLVGDARRRLLILLATVAAVLVIACANVGSLSLARAARRRKEIAMRAALGAGRFRIVRQLLTESVVLAIIAGAMGLLLGSWALRMFSSVVSAELPAFPHIQIDWTVGAFTVGLSLIAGIAFGAVPAIGISRFNLFDALKSTGRSASGPSTRLRSWLIAGEIGLTLILLVGAGLLIRSLYVLSSIDPGFGSKHVLATKISPEQSFCVQAAACVSFYSQLLAEARGIPGVVDAAVANTLPLDGLVPMIPVDVEDHPKTADFPAPMFWTGAVSPEYLRLMGVPLVAGREFSYLDAADSEPVVIITASTANRFWPGQNALGKHIKFVWETRWRNVVGVVRDVRQYNLENRMPAALSGAVYMPYSQSVQDDRHIPAVMNLIIRTAASAPQASEALYRLAVTRNPNIPVGKVVHLEQLVEDSVSTLRWTTWLFLSFAGVALIIATIGIYGLIAYSVSQRTHEISLRMAIGASNTSIVRMILGQALRVALAGLMVGVIGSLFLTRGLSALLFEVKTTDPLIYTAVSAFLMIVALAAALVPAWRASRIDPIRTLRSE
jgi:predicted permease